MTDIECTKRGYGSAHAAKAANSSNHHSMHVYVCEDCGQWHASKRTGRDTFALARRRRKG